MEVKTCVGDILDRHYGSMAWSYEGDKEKDKITMEYIYRSKGDLRLNVISSEGKTFSCVDTKVYHPFVSSEVCSKKKISKGSEIGRDTLEQGVCRAVDNAVVVIEERIEDLIEIAENHVLSCTDENGDQMSSRF